MQARRSKPRYRLKLAAALAALAVAALSGAGVADARVLASSPGTPSPLQKVLSKYFTNAELVAHMQEFASRCSAIAKLHDPIGYSVNGQPLYVLEISDKPGQEEPEPNFKYIANMHGDETGGRQLLLALAEWLCANYQTDGLARRMVTKMHTFLMPTMNPDGFTAGDRYNAKGADLNRDFPDKFVDPTMTPTGLEQPETAAVMKWSLSRQFTASANMHEGATVVNYPWDGSKSGDSGYNASPDDSTFKYLSTIYARRNPQLKNSQAFPGGITNGAAWYAITGGMQDWNYVKAGCFEVTLELWDVKGGANLATLFKNNQQSLVSYAVVSSLGGVRGTVTKAGTGLAVEAKITVSSSSFVTRSGKRFGDFYRPLAPGKHTIKVVAPGSPPQTFNVMVPADGTGVSLAVTIP